MNAILQIAIGDHYSSVAVSRVSLNEAHQAGRTFGCPRCIDVLFDFPPLHFGSTFLTLLTNGTATPAEYRWYLL